MVLDDLIKHLITTERIRQTDRQTDTPDLVNWLACLFHFIRLFFEVSSEHLHRILPSPLFVTELS